MVGFGKKLRLFLLFIFLNFLLTGCNSNTDTITSNVKTAPDKDAVLLEASHDYFENITESFYLIDGPGLKAKMDEPEKVFLIDMRQIKDFEVGHIPGAINIPFQELGNEFMNLPKDKDIILYCYSGQTAGQALSLLRINGFHAYSLLGGFPEWADNSKLPVEIK